jgi:hypothetical protein
LGKTRDFKWRTGQLNNLLRGLKVMQKELGEARTKDLGCDTFSGWLFEI